MLVNEGLKIGFTRRRKLVGGPGFEKMGVAIEVGIYEPHPTRLLVHLGRFDLSQSRNWSVSNLHGNSP